MENEENKELEVKEAPKPTRPKKRARTSGFGAEEVTKTPIVKPEPVPTPEPVEEKVEAPKQVVKKPAPAPAPAPAPVARRKERVARPLKRNPQGDGSQRGIRRRG